MSWGLSRRGGLESEDEGAGGEPGLAWGRDGETFRQLSRRAILWSNMLNKIQRVALVQSSALSLGTGRSFA